MGHTAIEKILAGKAETDSATAGDILNCAPDLIMGHDLTAPHALGVFREMGVEKVRDPSKIMLVQDHFQPAKDIKSAKLARIMRDFAREQEIKNYYEIGWGGICHILMLEKGLVGPGMLIAGADSHTLTVGAVGAAGYAVGATDLAALWVLGEMWLDVPRTLKITLDGIPGRFIGGKDISFTILGILGQEGAMDDAVEYSGSAFQHLSIPDRITIANMSTEAGATTSIISPDQTTIDWLRTTGLPDELLNTNALPDPDATYIGSHTIDVSKIQPMVAKPPSPADVHNVSDIEDIKVDQVFVGSCTNGTLEDIRRFADLIADNKFSKSTRVLVTPATQDIYVAAVSEGIVEKIVLAGGVVGTPSCGPCLGGYGGVLDAGEVCLSTSNRNFRGRMGHPDSLLWLSGPEVAAATAVTGKITHPAELT